MLAPHRVHFAAGAFVFPLGEARSAGKYREHNQRPDSCKQKTSVEIVRKQARERRHDADVKVGEAEVGQELFVLLWIHVPGNCGKLSRKRPEGAHINGVGKRD